MTQPQSLEVRREHVKLLCNDLTSDIKNINDKQWLIPALVSHVARLTQYGNTDTEKLVQTWWHAKTKRQ